MNLPLKTISATLFIGLIGSTIFHFYVRPYLESRLNR